jgi:hypothetical protein
MLESHSLADSVYRHVAPFLQIVKARLLFRLEQHDHDIRPLDAVQDVLQDNIDRALPYLAA